MIRRLTLKLEIGFHRSHPFFTHAEIANYKDISHGARRVWRGGLTLGVKEGNGCLLLLLHGHIVKSRPDRITKRRVDVWVVVSGGFK